MEEGDYLRIYRSLNSLEDLAEFDHPRGVLLAILTQKAVRRAKAQYRRVEADADSLRELWSGGSPILAIARAVGLPPVLTASIILRGEGLSRRRVRALLRDPKRARGRLREELSEAVREDFVYSPWAHRLQVERGRAGERVIARWLSGLGLRFIPEGAREGGGKTPDFLLEDPLPLGGLDVRWVESKASFGDRVEHKRYIEKQFAGYSEAFGSGMVVYWQGFLPTILPMMDRILVKDHTFFPEFRADLEPILNPVIRAP